MTDRGLAYFKNCKDLTVLGLTLMNVSDAGLANFKDCKDLRYLHLAFSKVTDAGLANFKDCKGLISLQFSGTQVSDAGLIHFKDCKNLSSLDVSYTGVGDSGLANFKGMPLRELKLQRSGITDLTPLQGMPLEEIRLTPKNITRGLDILRAMKTLKTIGVEWDKTWPAAEFWQRYDTGEFGFAPFTDAEVKRISALPAAEQIEEVLEELVKRNPGFDGKVEHKIEDGVVTEIRMVTDKVADVSPIRVWSALRKLDLSGTHTNWRGNSQLADLTSLNGMSFDRLTLPRPGSTQKCLTSALGVFKGCTKLVQLNLDDTKVSDAGMESFKNCKGITFLFIGDTQVGDSGLAHFQNCTGLTSMNLANTKVSDAGMKHLKNCKSLDVINLTSTKIGNRGGRTVPGLQKLFRSLFHTH